VVLFGIEGREEGSERVLYRHLIDDDRIRSHPTAYAITYWIPTICGIYRRSRFLDSGGCDTDPGVLYCEDRAMHVQLARGGLSFRADSRMGAVNYSVPTSMSQADPVRVLRSQLHLWSRLVREIDGEYRQELSHQLWHLSHAASMRRMWGLADGAADLAVSLTGPEPLYGDRAFRTALAIHLRIGVRAYGLAWPLLAWLHRRVIPVVRGPRN
jgi:hypothetical protein